MIIHTYFTDGFFPWAKFLLTSFKHFHGDSILFCMSTRDLNADQIQELSELYRNLKIDNHSLDIDQMSIKSGLPKDALLKAKKKIETDHIQNHETRIWKQLISVEDRYRNSILGEMLQHPEEDYMIHMDIDMYVRKPLYDLFNLVKMNDISIRFRHNSKGNRKVLGSLIGLKIHHTVYDFIDKWRYYIDAIDIKDKPIGYGQTSFYLAYLDMKNKLKWGDIPQPFSSPHMKETDVIWSGNTVKGKTVNLKLYQEDFKRKEKK